MSFDLFDHPLPLEVPLRRIPSTWIQHTPFAMFLMDILRPKLFVELGTFQGVSYSAFCQAVARLNLDTKCFGIDTWEGDPHTGFYGQDVLADLQGHHALRYGGFSKLIQNTFDNAKANFADGSIDLLHIDGYHTYEAAKHDFENWLSKLSTQGVVLLHDIHVYERDFGVWRFWEELKIRYPTFEVKYGCGLGVVAVGKNLPTAIRPLFDLPENDLQKIREVFRLLGERAEQDAAGLHDLQNKVDSLQQTILQQQAHNEYLQAQLDSILKQGVGFRLVRKYYRFVKKILPPHTHRRRLYDTVKQLTMQVLRFGQRILVKRSQTVKMETSMQNPVAGPEIVPMISVVMPVFNTPVQYLDAAIRSVKNQTHANWELCICDDGSSKPEIIDYLKQIMFETDSRIHVIFSIKNEGISQATNKAINLAQGKYITFLDHDDELTSNALEEIANILVEHPDTDIIYSDQDKIDSGQDLSEPFYKPDWSPEYFRHVMYVGHLLVVSRQLIHQAGGFDRAYDGIQDYEFMLRASELSSRIYHLPQILYHWRKIPGSVAMDTGEKGDIIAQLQVRAVNEHLKRLNISAVAVSHPKHPHRVVIKPIDRTDSPLISIIVPIEEYSLTEERCINSILEQSTYPNYEIIVVEKGSAQKAAPDSPNSRSIKVISANAKCNLSEKINFGVQNANGSFIVTLNSLIKITSSDWLQTLLFYFDLPDVGAVGSLLLYPDGTVFQAGFVLGLRGAADSIMQGYQFDHDGYAGSLSCPREISAVSIDCMMFRREDFNKLNGFNEYFVQGYQDMDFCLKLREQGKRVLLVPDSPLVKYEVRDNNLDAALFKDTWAERLQAGDPYYNKNFSRKSRDYQLK